MEAVVGSERPTQACLSTTDSLQNCTKPTAPHCSGPATLWSTGPGSWGKKAPRTFLKAQVRGSKGARQGAGAYQLAPVLEKAGWAGCGNRKLSDRVGGGAGRWGFCHSQTQAIVPQELRPELWLPGGPWDHSFSTPPVS